MFWGFYSFHCNDALDFTHASSMMAWLGQSSCIQHFLSLKKFSRKFVWKSTIWRYLGVFSLIKQLKWDMPTKSTCLMGKGGISRAWQVGHYMIPPCSITQKQRPKFYSLSLVMTASPYELNIFMHDAKHYTTKPASPGRSPGCLHLSYFCCRKHDATHKQTCEPWSEPGLSTLVILLL